MQLSPLPPQNTAPIIIPDDRPVYRITEQAGFFGPDDTLYPEGQIIAWADEPSMCMQPLNSMAREAKKKYLDNIDRLGRAAAKKAGKAYAGIADAIDAAIELERIGAKQVQVIGGEHKKEVLGNSKRKSNKVQAIVPEQAAPLMGRGSLSLGGTASQTNSIVDNKGLDDKKELDQGRD